MGCDVCVLKHNRCGMKPFIKQSRIVTNTFVPVINQNEKKKKKKNQTISGLRCVRQHDVVLPRHSCSRQTARADKLGCGASCVGCAVSSDYESRFARGKCAVYIVKEIRPFAVCSVFRGVPRLACCRQFCDKRIDNRSAYQDKILGLPGRGVYFAV